MVAVNGHSSSMNPLTGQQLTGRSATHIRDVPELESRLHADVIEPVLALQLPVSSTVWPTWVARSTSGLV